MTTTPVIGRPKLGDVLQERGRGRVRVTVVGMKYAHVTDLDGKRDRMVRFRELSEIVEPVPPAKPKKAGSDLDREFLDFSK
jgi:hypothetical protein